MKIQMILDKKEIDMMSSTLYLEGYSEYDRQYKELVFNITVKSNKSPHELLAALLGEFNVITKKIYEDVISQYLKIKYKKYPDIAKIYNEINLII